MIDAGAEVGISEGVVRFYRQLGAREAEVEDGRCFVFVQVWTSVVGEKI